MFKKILIILLPILFLGTSAQAMFSRGAVQSFKTQCVAMPRTAVQERGFVSLMKTFWDYRKIDRTLHKNFREELKKDKRQFKLFQTAGKELAQREQWFESLTTFNSPMRRFHEQKMTTKLNMKYVHTRLTKVERHVQQLNKNKQQYIQKKNAVLSKPFRWLEWIFR